MTMSMTYRKELYLTCDVDSCQKELILDQREGGYRCTAKTLRALAIKKYAWQIRTLGSKRILCPLHRRTAP